MGRCPAGAPGTLDAGTAPIRGYEARIQALETEKSSISLKRANEVATRHDVERRVEMKEKECERLRDEIVRLQLQVERKENSNSGNKPSTNVAPAISAKRKSRPTIRSITADAPGDTPGDCKQQ